MLLKSHLGSEPRVLLPDELLACYNYAYEGLILCVHCSAWNTKFAVACRHCCATLDERCIVCSYDGVPLYTRGGKNLLGDRLLPAGWKCCGCLALNMDDDGRRERWKCSRLGSWGYKHESEDKLGRPSHPPTFCPTCKVVNRYQRSLAYMGADYLVGRPTERGPLDLHFRFLDHGRQRKDRDLSSAEAAATESLRSIDAWIQLIRAARECEEQEQRVPAPECSETPVAEGMVVSVSESPRPLCGTSPRSEEIPLVTAFPEHEPMDCGPSVHEISESEFEDTSLDTQGQCGAEAPARRKEINTRGGYASSEQDHDMADEPESATSTSYANFYTLKHGPEEHGKTRHTPPEDDEVILDCIVVGGSDYELGDSDGDEYILS